MILKCKVCGAQYNRRQIGQKVCGWACAIEYAKIVDKANKAKIVRKETKEKKEKLKTRSDWMKEAQTVFNKWIRMRDDKLPCISCQRHHDGQYHAGHYLTVGARPELRFDEDNCHKQCSVCNNHLSGNLLMYRKNLIVKIGLERVESLEGHHEPLKITIDEIKYKIEFYKAKLKEGAHG